MKRDSRTPEHINAWRESPRDEAHARKPFPSKAEFIEHLRETGRPTTKDLRKRRALKKAQGQPAGPGGE